MASQKKVEHYQFVFPEERKNILKEMFKKRATEDIENDPISLKVRKGKKELSQDHCADIFKHFFFKKNEQGTRVLKKGIPQYLEGEIKSFSSSAYGAAFGKKTDRGNSMERMSAIAIYLTKNYDATFFSFNKINTLQDFIPYVFDDHLDIFCTEYDTSKFHKSQNIPSQIIKVIDSISNEGKAAFPKKKEEPESQKQKKQKKQKKFSKNLKKIIPPLLVILVVFYCFYSNKRNTSFCSQGKFLPSNSIIKNKEASIRVLFLHFSNKGNESLGVNIECILRDRFQDFRNEQNLSNKDIEFILADDSFSTYDKIGKKNDSIIINIGKKYKADYVIWGSYIREEKNSETLATFDVCGIWVPNKELQPITGKNTIEIDNISTETERVFRSQIGMSNNLLEKRDTTFFRTYVTLYNNNNMSFEHEEHIRFVLHYYYSLIKKDGVKALSILKGIDKINAYIAIEHLLLFQDENIIEEQGIYFEKTLNRVNKEELKFYLFSALVRQRFNIQALKGNSLDDLTPDFSAEIEIFNDSAYQYINNSFFDKKVDYKNIFLWRYYDVKATIMQIQKNSIDSILKYIELAEERYNLTPSQFRMFTPYKKHIFFYINKGYFSKGLRAIYKSLDNFNLPVDDIYDNPKVLQEYYRQKDSTIVNRVQLHLIEITDYILPIRRATAVEYLHKYWWKQIPNTNSGSYFVSNLLYGVIRLDMGKDCPKTLIDTPSENCKILEKDYKRIILQLKQMDKDRANFFRKEKINTHTQYIKKLREIK